MKKGEAASRDEDDDGGAEEGEYPAMAPPAAPEQPKNLLDLDEGPSPAPPAPPAGAPPAAGGEGVQGISDELIPRLKAWFNALVVGPQGVLFENDVLQVGIQHMYQQSQARIAIHIKNKTTTPMTNLAMAIPEMPYMRVSAQTPEATVQAGQSARCNIEAECMQPYDNAPEMSITCAVGATRYHYPLRLPMVATRFMDPVIIDKDEFMKRWNALSDKDREQQEVWNSKSPIDSARMEDIKSRIIVNGIKLGQATGLDQNEYTLSACGTFRTGTVAPNGTKISVGCLIRLEANPQVLTHTIPLSTCTCPAFRFPLSVSPSPSLHVL